MHSHEDEIKNDRLMVFSPRPVLLHEKSHPLWGFRGSVIESDRTGIFPLKWFTKSLRERQIGYVPPTIEEYARTDYDSLVFAITRTLAGKCVRSCHWLLEHDCSGGQGGGRCIFPPFHKGLCLCEPCRSHIGHRMGQNTARADGNTFLDEFHDTVSCNEKWRKKYPSIYDRAESISTAYSHQSYTYHTPSWKAKEQLQHEDDLVVNFANEQPQSESSDNESDEKRKRRRIKKDPYSYLPGSPIPEGPSDIEIRAALHWDNMLRKESEPAGALWSSEITEDNILLNIDLSQAVDTSSQTSVSPSKPPTGEEPQCSSKPPTGVTNRELLRQANSDGELLRQAKGRYCPKLCYGNCPNNCPQYSNIENGNKTNMAAPLSKKEKTLDVSETP
jgi:hypothetical protein